MDADQVSAENKNLVRIDWSCKTHGDSTNDSNDVIEKKSTFASQAIGDPSSNEPYMETKYKLLSIYIYKRGHELTGNSSGVGGIHI